MASTVTMPIITSSSVNDGGVFVSVDTRNAGVDASSARDILYNAGGHSSSRAKHTTAAY